MALQSLAQSVQIMSVLNRCWSDTTRIGAGYFSLMITGLLLRNEAGQRLDLKSGIAVGSRGFSPPYCFKY